MLAFCCRDALLLLHQRRGSLHPMQLLWASPRLWQCLGTSSCPSSLGRRMRKLVSLPGKGMFSLQGKSLSGHRVVAVPSSPRPMEKLGTALASLPTSEKKGSKEL